MFYNRLTNHLLNIKGWHTKRKIIVIQSDDWGSIRMPSNKVRKILKNNSDIKFNNAYTKYDTLASAKDLEILFETLSSVKDKYGKPAVLTANCLMANPDFEKIRNDNFQTYHFEHITTSFNRYNNERALLLWKEGLSKGIFFPQFHGREHVNHPFWLEMLRENNHAVRKSFDQKTFGLSFKNLKYNQSNFQRAWDLLCSESEEIISQGIIEGLEMFEDYFGFKSITAIPPNYTWSKSQEILLKKKGVLAVQGMLKQRVVNGINQPYSYNNRFTRSSSNNFLAYQRRNVFFEPSQGKTKDVLDTALDRIQISFRMCKPAIIGTHRVNFIGGLSEANRDNNISMFRELLQKITSKWPDIVFMSAADLAKEMDDA